MDSTEPPDTRLIGRDAVRVLQHDDGRWAVAIEQVGRGHLYRSFIWSVSRNEISMAANKLAAAPIRLRRRPKSLGMILGAQPVTVVGMDPETWKLHGWTEAAGE